MRPTRTAVIRPLLVVVPALILALSIGTPPVATAEGSVVVHASLADVDFPQSVTFRLEAESATQITDVSLQVNTPGQRYGAAVRNVRPSFTPGQSVSATWTWPRAGNGLPPGTEIIYRWRITAADGSVTETAQESIRVQDRRYQWQELTEGPITVRWYRGGDAFGREIMAAAKESAARLARLQGVDLRNALTIHVYGSQPELFEAVPGAPGWIGGIAIPEFDTVMIGIEPSNLSWGRRALTHEIAHQLVYQMTAHPTLGSRVPTWLNEGLAVVAEGESEDRNQTLLDEAVANNTLPTLRALNAPFSAQSGHLAGVAYAASESAVRFLLDEFGPEPMRTMLQALSDGLTANEASTRAYGRTLDSLEDTWRTSLGLEPLERTAPDRAAPADGASQAAPRPSAAVTERGPDLLWSVAALVAITVVFGVAGGFLIARRWRSPASDQE
jgi:hypothetical protein